MKEGNFETLLEVPCCSLVSFPASCALASVWFFGESFVKVDLRSCLFVFCDVALLSNIVAHVHYTYLH